MYKIYTNNWDIPDGYLYKIWLIMRLTTVILIATIMQVGAAGFAQKISMVKSKAPLKTVLKELKSQSGYIFLYTESVLKLAKPVDIKVNNADFQDVLELIFENQPLSYTINESTITVKEKAPSLLDKLNAVISNIVKDLTIKGKVTDQDGKPLPNASIRVKGRSAVTNTNQNGEFEIKGVDEGAVLQVSYVGFKTLEIALKDAVMPLEIKLNVATGELEEVKVVYNTGYQELNKERATGSFVQIDNETINRGVSTNILDRIKYLTSSVKTQASDGLNGSDISIRGLSTINANQKPLIVVDGFPYEEGNGFFQLMIENINPNDIETITILRDAAAASIWGARSANGVIVITTKKGKFNQKTNVQFRSTVNITERPDLAKINTMSSADVIDYEKKLFEKGVYNDYDDLYPSFHYFPVVSPATEILLAERRGDINQEAADLKLKELSEHDVRDDINEYLLRKSINQQYSLSIDGGGENMNYYGSVGYDKNIESTIGNLYDRLSVKLDNSYRPIKNLELNTYINYTQNRTQNNGINYVNYLANGTSQIAPYTMLADDYGVPLHAPYSGVNLFRQNYIDTLNTNGLLDWHYKPIEEIQHNDNSGKLFNIRLGGGIKYSIIQGLKLDLTGQYERSISDINNYHSDKTYLARNLINQFMFIDATGQSKYPVPLNGILDLGNIKQTAYNLRGQLSLDQSWNIHTISAILGTDIRESEYDFNVSRKYGYDPLTLGFASNMDYNTDYTLRPLNSGTIPDGNSSTGNINHYLSYYTNIGYTVFNKYIFTASGRIDASNFFGVKTNLKKVPLWSVGIGWDINKEGIFTSKTISSLKLRATFGFNGNLDNTTTSRATINYRNGFSRYNNFKQYSDLNSPPNPGLTWEKVKTINFAIDFGFFDNRLNGSFEYYSKKATDLIGPIVPDVTSGLNYTYNGNVASLKGNGIDLNLNSTIRSGNFRLISNIFFSYNTNKVISYYQDPKILKDGNNYVGGGTNLIEGKPIGNLYAYKWAGLDHTTGDPLGMVGGKIVPFTTVTGYIGNESNTKPEDLVYYGRTSAPFFGNIINTFSYKELSFSFNIIYKLGYYFLRPSIDFNTIQSNWSGHGDYALRWQKPGDELKTNVPSFPENPDGRYDFYSKSDALVERGDHIRLQDIRLSYELNKKNIKGLPFNNASFFINANNLGILWRRNDRGIDPDFYYNQVPTSRSIAFGLNLNYK
ncbi:TonB-linked SusC/RagA family outer membrane protein [Pedobacter sp. AK017]|uniref:SusC/RagA family TonB-linked outer membrane protein n=1 Tax=Pedobacter sp. AK017 TaxID=2723073 RepID=UPI00161CE837|nr:SusC/RagA family TonB-linked outer membrane protein [Pedobacter sp. AK017]MBB5439513.1 TonB-linked SusC/RagA family outer membrane protein [Pedobacter sp. AK017]